MKIQKSKNTKRKKLLLALVILVVVLAGAYAAYSLTLDQNNDSSQKEKTKKTQSKKSNAATSEESTPDSPTDSKNTATNTDRPAPVTTDDETGKKVVQMVASVDSSNNMIYIRGGINNSVEYNGSCFVSLRGPNGQIIRKETTLLQNAATTDCKTIQIDSNELSTGTWKFTLNFTSNTTEGSSSENSFEIK